MSTMDSSGPLSKRQKYNDMDLSDDIWLCIFNLLKDYKDIVACKRTCKSFDSLLFNSNLESKILDRIKLKITCVYYLVDGKVQIYNIYTEIGDVIKLKRKELIDLDKSIEEVHFFTLKCTNKGKLINSILKNSIKFNDITASLIYIEMSKSWVYDSHYAMTFRPIEENKINALLYNMEALVEIGEFNPTDDLVYEIKMRTTKNK